MPRSCAPIRTPRARQKKGAQEIGRSRGGPSTKVHVVVDALGNPVRIALSPGQTHEMRLAYSLLSGLENAYVAGDKAYDAQPLVQMLEDKGCTAVIPSNERNTGGISHREIDEHLYKERHLVECFFQRIKRFRRISMRFEKLARTFLGFLYLASVLVWLV